MWICQWLEQTSNILPKISVRNFEVYVFNNMTIQKKKKGDKMIGSLEIITYNSMLKVEHVKPTKERYG